MKNMGLFFAYQTTMSMSKLSNEAKNLTLGELMEIVSARKPIPPKLVDEFARFGKVVPKEILK